MDYQRSEPIAIVGSGCRFPGAANSPAALWKLLENPRDILSEIPKERFDVRGWYHRDGDHHGTSNVLHSYTLEEDLTKFDANFFGISAGEAESIDPQQRLLLETVYEALEAGGHTIQSLRGSDTAVYVGVMGGDHETSLLRDANSLPTYFATGTSRAILSNRISYFFDWRGPSMTIDTACSSSMIAVHNAVQALRSSDSRVAIACGSTLLLGPEMYVAESNMHMLSPTGRSRMWDADADGYARGDGIASVVLKKLSDALADGDHIECIIRETGINQDGRTQGITVPSSDAQAALIRRTYARAGLDLANPADRPQFFEAHGTGTKVGDPKEAAAIHSSFGGLQGEPLYVGSIKTVIGHTEGAAGIAGLLKASLSLQAGVIPPNRLFNRLNPSIEPFIQGLQVPTQAKPWPALPKDGVRRASVNSFGFGGANSHAILESYQAQVDNAISALDVLATPFVFSAASNTSLVSSLQAHLDYLKTNKVNMRDLAWTLQQRRSTFSHKIAFSAPDVESLIRNIELRLEEYKDKSEANIGVRSSSASPKILGVFTGQGAQWPAMGAELIRSSEFVRRRFQELDYALATLPPADRPTWKIADQLLLDAKSSRITEAAFSQPLCTAVQVVLVDLLRSAGIMPSSVVGHSSGEIGAAYAADFINARDAIRIAYYRGLYAKLAGGAVGQKGAMLAVGTSLEDATEVIELDAFVGRIAVAAHNSPASVTLSGDADAILEVKTVFEEEKKFARMLKVDTAYHSHHMLACGEAYVKALRACRVEVNRNRDTSVTWYSSVTGGEVMEPTTLLQDLYWRDNMVQRVSFYEAVTAAARAEQPTLAIEIGPHAALKGPTQQNIAETGLNLPYTGVMCRGLNDVQAFSDGLGYIWTQFGPEAVDFAAFERLFLDAPQPKLAIGLPSYKWDQKTHWQESRIARKMRTRSDPFHELLGVPHVDNTELERRWSNVLKISEVPWLTGHKLQGDPVFPAAGYASMAFEAAKSIMGSRPVKLIELRDMVIGKAITFGGESDPAAETLVTLTDITPSKSDSKTRAAKFSVYSAAIKSARDLEVNASGTINIIFGEPSLSVLPPIQVDDSNMAETDSERFYTSLATIGYEYSDSFRTMENLKRKLNQATALISSFDYGDESERLMVHPALLDVAFQTAILAYSAPDDGRLWSLHVPTFFECIRVNPELCATLPLHSVQLPVRAQLLAPKANGVDSIRGNLDILSIDKQHAMIQVQGAAVVPVSTAQVSDDRTVFSYTKLGVAAPDGELALGELKPSTTEMELGAVRERLAFFYYRKWIHELTEADWTKSEWHFQCLRKSINWTLSLVDAGNHPYILPEWQNDTQTQIDALFKAHSDSVDCRLVRTVGETLPSAVRRQSTMIEHMMKDGLLDEFYKYGLGFQVYNESLGRMVSQFTHVYPRAKIFEVGAGTGGATKFVLETIGNTFSSYTYTDISSGYFEKAAEAFSDWKDKLIFKSFDTERTPESQDFQEGTYDLILASNVLHATESMEKTLKNVRRLLKPGGYLMLLEITNNKLAAFTSMFGGISGWWAGCEDGRPYAPTMPLEDWNTVLRQSGFSGVDSTTPNRDQLSWPFSVIAAQAVDDRVNYLKKPLYRSPNAPEISQLTIIGGRSLEVAKIAEDIADIAGLKCQLVESFADLISAQSSVVPGQTVICLSDLEDPMFQSLTPEKMDALKIILENSQTLLWVGRDSRDHPYQQAMVGFLRCIIHEMPHLSVQHLDIASSLKGVSTLITEVALRLHTVSQWEASDDLDQQLLYTKETELMFEAETLYAPRMLPDPTRNDRINSQRRSVAKVASLKSNVISIGETGSGLPILKDVPFFSKGKEGRSAMKTCVSTLSALGITAGLYLFVSVGLEISTSKAVIALSSSNSNESYPVVTIPTDIQGDPAGLLSAISAELLAARMLSTVVEGSKVLVHEPGTGSLGSSLAQALTRQAFARKIEVIFSTSRADEDPSWLRLSPWMHDHNIKRLLPTGVTHLLDLAIDEESKEVSALIQQALSGVQYTGSKDLWRATSSGLFQDQEMLISLLKNAATGAAQHVASHKPTELSLSQVADVQTPLHPATLVDWTAEEIASVTVDTIDATPLFSADKSYLMVGLTGQIGQSLCEWMVRNGARNILLTSRHPSVDQKWLDSFKAYGAKVAVYAMDVTNKANVIQVVNDIQESYPPIMGVANAAMVLKDTLFSQMSYEQMTDVLRPKIDGTNWLDEIFYDTPLDFFVCFSSTSSVGGVFGQSNYAAACSYMTSLVRQRRARGLAGSAFDIGRVAGIGYIERASQVVQETFEKYSYMPLSETDLHQMFAETIFAGIPEMNLDPVISTGIERVPADRKHLPPWITYPRLSHYLIDTQATTTVSDSKQTVQPVREQLVEATTAEQVLSIIKTCFAAKLQIVLQLTDEEVDIDVPLVEIGIDSLVAVEVRSWFLKELQTDMPVLKILGGGSVSELAEQASKKLPAELVPMLSDAATPSIPKAEKEKSGERPIMHQEVSFVATSANKPKRHTSWERPAVRHALSFAETATTTATHSRTESIATPPSSVSAKSSISDLRAIKESKELREFEVLKTEPMSLSQSRFWLLDLFLEDRTASNVAFQYQLNGHLEADKLSQALELVAMRHESLRTFFVNDVSQPDMAVQSVSDTNHVKLEHRTINHVDEAAQEYEMHKRHDFDLGKPQLLRMTLLTLNNTTHYLLIAYHHIIMDGISLQVLLSDLELAYNGTPLGPSPMQFPAYSVNQCKALESGAMDSELEYWKGVFHDSPAVLPLLPMAITGSRTPISAFKSNEVSRRVNPVTGQKVKAVARMSRSTNFHVYLTVFRILIARLADATDLTIGIADANRTEDDTTRTIGLFLNLLPLRFKPDEAKTFAASVTETRNQAYAALGNSKLPFDIMLQELHHVERSSTHAPFFQAFFDYKVGVKQISKFGNCQMDMQQNNTGETNYDINITVIEDDQGPGVIFETQASIYDRHATTLLLESYINLLEVFVNAPTTKTGEPSLYSQGQIQRALDMGKGPDLLSEWPATLSSRVEQVARQNKDAVAVRDGNGNSISYGALMSRSQAIAATLQNAGVVSGSKIVVFQQPSVDWIVSLLAIWRIGCIYVPLDVANPLTRLAAIVETCQPSVILTDATTSPNVNSLRAANALTLNVSKVPDYASAIVPDLSRGTQAAVIIYTSGSTGTPKGITVKHEGLRNYIEGSVKMYGMETPQTTLQQSALSFDISLEQIFTGLATGGSVFMCPLHQRGDPQEITKVMRDQHITYSQATPSEYLMWLQFGMSTLRQCSDWKYAIAGGERLTNTVANHFATLNLSDVRLINSYGPAEISCGSSFHEIDYRQGDLGDIPIGSQYPNYSAYIVDKNLKPLPIGIAGEIVIGGAGVAAGYANDAALTSTQFVPNPFATTAYVANGWSKMYRTGDYGHFREDGSLVFRHRISSDLQVKIRGLRIELGDIESNIVRAGNGSILEAVVTVHGEESDFLVAHVVFDTKRDIADKDAFLQNLLQDLPIPRYMVPAMAIPIDHLPLNNHSKVDRKAVKALPLPDHIATPAVSSELTDTEAELFRLWQEVLSTPVTNIAITPATNFFSVGGNSLLIVRLQARIRKELSVVVSVFELMSSSTLGEMASKIEESVGVESIDWERETAVPFMVTPAPVEPHTAPRNQPKVVVLTGATGFLGRHLLSRLETDPNIAKIHCVAVRNKSVESSPKASVYHGDLSDPMLGLSQSEFEDLSRSADVIIHLGAVRSFWDNYHALRQTNVQPIKELVKLAAARRVPIHFISSSGVLPTTAYAPIGASVAQNLPPTDGSNGYVASKWAGERILERANADFDIPVSIHRFVAGGAEPPRDAVTPVMQWLAQHSEMHKIKPDIAGWRGHIDLLKMDEATKALCESLVGDSPRARFLHHESHVRLRECDMEAFVGVRKGRADMEEMELLDWFGRIKDDGFEYFLSSHMASFQAGDQNEGDVLTMRR
ncbi:putative lovastatin nonaketide synthase [Paraphoma chrysanthemicola]|uniref:Lovastatin nonaketide synthase n=1 Tax=Paraphoma chrysanthemicola TaxID=798071 RepID=A0A8K0R0C3_9PLEO|nr:putative lovastatin nonaketide synthase [Paraphoma chrysanthemicola]